MLCPYIYADYGTLCCLYNPTPRTTSLVKTEMWASFLPYMHRRMVNNNPTCPLCRGDARMQELVPQRVVLNDDGTVRKSTMKPGFLSQLPGRKALPFKNTNRAVTTKRKRSADQLQTTGTAHSTYTQHTHTHPTCTQHIHSTYTV